MHRDWIRIEIIFAYCFSYVICDSLDCDFRFNYLGENQFLERVDAIETLSSQSLDWVLFK